VTPLDGAKKNRTKMTKPLQILSKLDHADRRKKYPNIPDHALPSNKFSDGTANGLTAAVIRYLTLEGHYCSRIQSQGQYRASVGRWTKSTVKRGIGDLIAIINGKTIMIEIKVKRDQQSTYQKQTQIEVEQSGGTYLIVRDFDSFYNWYTNFLNH
jgi:hypothetical protein